MKICARLYISITSLGHVTPLSYRVIPRLGILAIFRHSYSSAISLPKIAKRFQLLHVPDNGDGEDEEGNKSKITYSYIVQIRVATVKT